MLTLFVCGDVMTGRGVDQILPYPSRPEIHEPYVRDARDYVELAEATSGPIPHSVAPSYIWGDALDELEQAAPDVRIINLETSVTTSDEHWQGKGINYRMHPLNLPCLTAARIDVCALANNHVLDYGYAGLDETLKALRAAGLKIAGAGLNVIEARRPVVIKLPDHHRVIVFSFGVESSGIPPVWAATAERPGVDFLGDLSETTATEIVERVRRVKRAGDVVVASIHWGSNWGYQVPQDHIRFAHRLIDGNVDVVHGHSSHHPRSIEVYRRKLVLYGCGDFFNDYEGISGYEEFRDDLTLMYFPTIDLCTGELVRLRMTPMRIRNIRLNRTTPEEAEWLRCTLDRMSCTFGSGVEQVADGRLGLCWQN